MVGTTVLLLNVHSERTSMNTRFSTVFKIGNRLVGEGQPALIIADLGGNFDGSLDKAKKLAKLVKEAGADVVKIQSFKAGKDCLCFGLCFDETSRRAWELGKPVDEVFKAVGFLASGIRNSSTTAMTSVSSSSSPWDYNEAVDIMDEADVPFYKIGSGDITWLEMLEYIAKKGKPVILATGASTLAEVDEAVSVIERAGTATLHLQCITNYPSKIEIANIWLLIPTPQHLMVSLLVTPITRSQIYSCSWCGCARSKSYREAFHR